MTVSQQFGDEANLRRYEYDDELVFAADFGAEREADVDIVDDTVLVVLDDEQYDVEVDGDARAFFHNGVLTIEVER